MISRSVEFSKKSKASMTKFHILHLVPNTNQDWLSDNKYTALLANQAGKCSKHCKRPNISINYPNVFTQFSPLILTKMLKTVKLYYAALITMALEFGNSLMSLSDMSFSMKYHLLIFSSKSFHLGMGPKLHTLCRFMEQGMIACRLPCLLELAKRRLQLSL